jgi:osmoprotectant transport system substrate-binding protein
LILGCVLLFAGFAQAAEKPLIRIGARVFTEQTLLAEITSQYLRTKGYDVRVTGGLGSNLARRPRKAATGPDLGIHRRVAGGLQPCRRETRQRTVLRRVKELDAKKAWSG